MANDLAKVLEISAAGAGDAGLAESGKELVAGARGEERVRVARRLLARAVRALSPLAGVAAHHRLMQQTLVCPVYHLSREITPVWWNGRYSIKSPREFEEELDLLMQFGSPLSLDDLLNWQQGRLPRPKGWFLSFDDGYRELYDVVAPILKRKGIPATFFLCSSLIDNRAPFFEDLAGWIAVRFAHATSTKQSAIQSELRSHGWTVQKLLDSRVPQWTLLEWTANELSFDVAQWLAEEQPYLTSQQVSSLLSEGFHVGAHSVDHPLFSALSSTERIQQIRGSIGQLRNAFPTVSPVFAFPYGEFGLYGNELRAVLESTEVSMCFGTRGIIADELEPFLVQRMLCEGHAGSFRSHVKSELSIQLQRLCNGRGTVRRPEAED
jgi:peptidoglycan/xylan/chitin deacetylase (PgdA/CDA1 family)